MNIYAADFCHQAIDLGVQSVHAVIPTTISDAFNRITAVAIDALASLQLTFSKFVTDMIGVVSYATINLRYYFTFSIEDAIRSGDEAVVRLYLLPENAFSQHRLVDLFRLACYHGHQSIAQILLPLITQWQWYEIGLRLRDSASNGWVEIVESLIQLGPTRRAIQRAIDEATNAQIRAILINALNMLPNDEIGHHQGVFQLTLEDVRNQPATYLNRICNEGLPQSVNFIDNPAAIDVGGLTKQFISTLGESLISKNVILRSQEGLIETSSEAHLTILGKMGKFFSLLDVKNSQSFDKLLVGQLFHNRFFEFVKIAGSLQSEEAKMQQIANLLKEIDPNQWTLIADCLNHPTDENKSAIKDALYLEDHEDPIVKAQSYVRKYYLTAHAFFEGCLEPLKAKIRTSNPLELLKSLQGEPVTKDRLLAAVQIAPNVQQTLSLQQKVNWIHNKINTADDEWRLRFVRTITGKRTLEPQVQIKVKETRRQGEVFEIHTCFNSIDVPRVQMTPEAFIAALDGALEGEGYNIG